MDSTEPSSDPDNPQAPESKEPTQNASMDGIDDIENELCIHCAKTNAPHAKFCRHCRAPIHPLSAICPYERVLATGFVWRSAVERPNLCVLTGVWLYFLISVAGGLTTLWWAYQFRDTTSLLGWMLIASALLGTGILTLLGVAMLARVTQAYFTKRM